MGTNWKRRMEMFRNIAPFNLATFMLKPSIESSTDMYIMIPDFIILHVYIIKNIKFSLVSCMCIQEKKLDLKRNTIWVRKMFKW